MARTKYTVTFPAARAGDQVTTDQDVYLENDSRNTTRRLDLNESQTSVFYSDAASVTVSWKPRGGGAAVTQTVTSGAPTKTGSGLPNDWQPNTAYAAGSLVINNSTMYRAKTSFTSGATFAATNWEQLGSAAFQGLGTGPSASLAALPRFSEAVRANDEGAPTTLTILGIGSSVGLGPNGGIDATNAASAWFATKIKDALAAFQTITVNHTNGSVGGHTLTDGVNTDYAAAKTAASVTTIPGGIVTLAWGMNDGGSGQYHAGQTYPFVYTNTVALIKAIRDDGGDPVVFTSPHPRTDGQYDFSWGGGISYPSGGVAIPGLTTVASMATGDYAGLGTNITISKRHYRVNQAMRQAAIDTGACLIDVEAYWFRAIAAYGEAALFDTGQTNHPNLFGYQQSYQAAINDFGKSLKASLVSAPRGMSRYSEIVVRDKQADQSVTNSNTIVDDADLYFWAPANSRWKITVDFTYAGATAGDIQTAFSAPTGATGRHNLTGMGTAAANLNNDTSKAGPGGNFNGGISLGATTQDALGYDHAHIVVGSTPGLIRWRWAQNTADASTLTVKGPGTTMIATRIR